MQYEEKKNFPFFFNFDELRKFLIFRDLIWRKIGGDDAIGHEFDAGEK